MLTQINAVKDKRGEITRIVKVPAVCFLQANAVDFKTVTGNVIFKKKLKCLTSRWHVCLVFVIKQNY